MIIGAVDGATITGDTPLDPSQWWQGKPWFWKEAHDDDSTRDMG